MSRVVFVLGWCGSGKSTRALELAAEGFANLDGKATGCSSEGISGNLRQNDLMVQALHDGVFQLPPQTRLLRTVRR